MSICQECAQPTTWADDVGSSICTACGTLVDPSQSVLTSHLDQHDNSTRQYDLFSIPSSTLKSFRSHSGWNLAGQGKEARDLKNNYAMHEFIRTVSSSLSVSAISARAIALFSQTMAAGHFRWGRKAKLTAAAAVAVALRESHRSDSLSDIAFLIDEPPLALSRAFSSIINTLNLSLTSADPASHLSALHLHLTSLLHPSQPPSPLPSKSLSLLTPLSLPTILRTANTLAALLTRLGDTLSLAHQPTPPTACAILIVAIEAEARTSLPNLSDLAHHLGTRLGAGKGVVLSRYKFICDLVEEWAREVPWLDKFKPRNGRSKLAKRVVVARGLKDVLQFQEDIWHKKLKATVRPTVVLDLDPDNPKDDADLPQPMAEHTPERICKKQKTHHELDNASHFLLNPLSAPALSPRSANAPQLSPIPFAAYLLTADASVLGLGVPPTRLQCLTAERGGAEKILDHELFEEGELEAMLRTEAEQVVLKDLYGWRENHEENLMQGEDEGEGSRGGEGENRTSSRINMEALSNLLRNTESIDEDEVLKQLEFGYAFSDEYCPDDHGSNHRETRPTPLGVGDNGTDEVVETWRPLSPDHAAGDRYDEEY